MVAPPSPVRSFVMSIVFRLRMEIESRDREVSQTFRYLSHVEDSLKAVDQSSPEMRSLPPNEIDRIAQLVMEREINK